MKYFLVVYKNIFPTEYELVPDPLPVPAAVARAGPELVVAVVLAGICRGHVASNTVSVQKTGGLQTKILDMYRYLDI